MELVAACLGRGIPVLGICLGFQALVEACGGIIAPVGPVHGRSDRVEVTEAGRADAALSVLDGGPLDVARYHSLGTRELPEDLVHATQVSAQTDRGLTRPMTRTPYPGRGGCTCHSRVDPPLETT